jgi:hypothetical protein
VGGVKKCFLGLRQTALLSAEGKNAVTSWLKCVIVKIDSFSVSGMCSG